MAETAAIIPAVAAIAGAGVSAESSVRQRRAAQAQSKQAKINAAKIEASNKIELERERRLGRARAGAARARAGSSGIQFTGSAVNLLSDELFENVLNEAILTSTGGQAVAQQRNLASNIRSRGRAQLTSGLVGAATTGLTIGSQVSRAGSII
jgi:hypothetical protein